MAKRKFSSFGDVLQSATSNRSLAFSLLIIGALIAFEIFNFSTTDFALTDLLGDLQFAGMRWSTILALAFCGMDFAGIARIFTPEQGSDEPAEVWYFYKPLELHPCGITEFFTRIMQRQIPALASGYPPIIVRCPIETCAGWVRGGEGVSWYCDTCSYEWDDRDEINQAVAEIIVARPYRAACYVKNGDNFDPAPRAREPADYESLVEAELDD